MHCWLMAYLMAAVTACLMASLMTDTSPLQEALQILIGHAFLHCACTALCTFINAFSHFCMHAIIGCTAVLNPALQPFCLRALMVDALLSRALHHTNTGCLRAFTYAALHCCAVAWATAMLTACSRHAPWLMACMICRQSEVASCFTVGFGLRNIAWGTVIFIKGCVALFWQVYGMRTNGYLVVAVAIYDHNIRARFVADAHSVAYCVIELAVVFLAQLDLMSQFTCREWHFISWTILT